MFSIVSNAACARVITTTKFTTSKRNVAVRYVVVDAFERAISKPPSCG
jgi:hypothetical protein